MRAFAWTFSSFCAECQQQACPHCEQRIAHIENVLISGWTCFTPVWRRQAAYVIIMWYNGYNGYKMNPKNCHICNVPNWSCSYFKVRNVKKYHNNETLLCLQMLFSRCKKTCQQMSHHHDFCKWELSKMIVLTHCDPCHTYNIVICRCFALYCAFLSAICNCLDTAKKDWFIQEWLCFF